jgi:hypothetical protein
VPLRMYDSDARSRPAPSNATDSNTSSSDRRAVMLKRDVAGMSYSEGADRLRPSAPVSGSPVVQRETSEQGGQDLAPTNFVVAGPMGRIFNRIMGVEETRTDTGLMGFNREQLRVYLDKSLRLAKGEFLRTLKLDGVADKLMERLDVDGDGKVNWAEFQAFEAQVLEALAPGVSGESTPEEVEASAGRRFDSMDSDKNDSMSYSELKSGAAKRLPEGTEHAALVAQLGARIGIEAADTDERSKHVKKRHISRDEWIEAALAITGRLGQ